MYFPFPRSQNPTNRECRVASILSIIGFVAAGWAALLPPNGFLSFLGAVAAILFLNWLGLATLLRARPSQGRLWPQITGRPSSGDRAAPLDERDTLIRYRTFLASYQILSVFIWVIVIVPGVLGANIQALTARYHGPLELGLVTLSLLMVLTWLLPQWVLPWLESNATFDPEPDLELTPPSGAFTRAGMASSAWLRLLWNGALWIFIFFAMSWIFRSYVPGGLSAMFR